MYCLYWFHQWGIPRRTCRFYCSLRGHQRTGTAGFANPPFPILWTLTLPPNHAGVVQGDRCGGIFLLPRVWGNLGIRCPVQVAYRHFDVRIGCFVFDPVSFAFQLVLFGLYRSFFIIGWKKDAVCLALSHVFGITTQCIA